MRKIALLLLISLAITSYTIAKNAKFKIANEANKVSTGTDQVDFSRISNFYGQWQIINIEKYRGGLTTEVEAKEYIGQSITIADNEFIFILEGKVKRPIYKYKKINNKLPEGEVPMNKTTAFYGFKGDRDYVYLFEVYDSKEIFINIEIITYDEIIIPFDGWLLFLNRTK